MQRNSHIIINLAKVKKPKDVKAENKWKPIEENECKDIRFLSRTVASQQKLFNETAREEYYIQQFYSSKTKEKKFHR